MYTDTFRTLSHTAVTLSQGESKLIFWLSLIFRKMVGRIASRGIGLMRVFSALRIHRGREEGTYYTCTHTLFLCLLLLCLTKTVPNNIFGRNESMSKIVLSW